MDGSVIISTELDNSRIPEDLKEIKKEAQKTENYVKDYANSFDTAAAKSDKSKRSIKDDLGEIQDSLAGVKDAILAGFTVGAVVDFTTGLIDSTSDLRFNLSILEQNAINAGVCNGSLQNAQHDQRRGRQQR